MLDFEELELLKLWKGLYFCMWMADKPLVQVGRPGDCVLHAVWLELISVHEGS